MQVCDFIDDAEYQVVGSFDISHGGLVWKSSARVRSSWSFRALARVALHALDCTVNGLVAHAIQCEQLLQLCCRG